MSDLEAGAVETAVALARAATPDVNAPGDYAPIDPPARVFLLHGINGWNTGDLGLLEVTVRRLRAELGPETVIEVEDSFLGTAPGHHEIAQRLAVATVAPMLPLRKTAGVSRLRWSAWLLASLGGAVVGRVGGRRAMSLMPGRIRPTLSAMASADVVISKPGGHIMATAGQRFPSPSHLAMVLAAKLLGRPVVVYAQTIGPFSSPLADWIARTVLGRTDLITARDPQTAAWLGKARPEGGRPRVELTADEAFLIEPADDGPAGAWSAERRPRLAVTAIAWRFPGSPDPAADRAAYEAALAGAARWFIDELGGEVRLVRWLAGDHREDDEAVLQRLTAAIVAVLGAGDLVVATRMHSAILAMAGGTPVVAIGYLPKTEAVMSLAGLAEHSIPIRDASAERLVGQINAKWQVRQDARADVETTVAQLRSRAQLNAALVRGLVVATRRAGRAVPSGHRATR